MAFDKLYPSLQDAVLGDDNLSFAALILLCNIIPLCRKDGVCSMSGSNLAKHLHRSIDQYKRYREELITAGYITKERVNRRKSVIRLTEKTQEIIAKDDTPSSADMHHSVVQICTTQKGRSAPLTDTLTEVSNRKKAAPALSGGGAPSPRTETQKAPAGASGEGEIVREPDGQLYRITKGKDGKLRRCKIKE